MSYGNLIASVVFQRKLQNFRRGPWFVRFNGFINQTHPLCLAYYFFIFWIQQTK
jgi:hypothetical protein